MTEVGSADLSRLLQSKRNECRSVGGASYAANFSDSKTVIIGLLTTCSSIVTSRKRKLRELFAVATQVESLPHDALANPDAPTTTPAEWQFLQANDILQYVLILLCPPTTANETRLLSVASMDLFFFSIHLSICSSKSRCVRSTNWFFRGKIFNELNVPSRPLLSLETLKQSLARSTSTTPDASSPAPPKSLEKDPVSPAQDEGPTEATPPVSGVDAGAATPMSTTTNEASRATPSVPEAKPLTPEKTKQQQQPPTPVNGVLKRTSTPDVTETDVDSDAVASPVKRQDEESTRAALVEETVQRRPAQVSFPPGTKGSPSEEPTNVKTGAGEESTKEASVPRDGDDVSAAQGTKPTEPLAIKPPTDVPKVADALSSPGSTAQSATTPAVQDVSTDTSPDHEAPQFVVPAEQKLESDADVEKTPSAEKVKELEEPQNEAQMDDVHDEALDVPPDSAEAQLLQESIRSSAAAASPVPVPVPEPKSTAPAHVEDTSMETDVKTDGKHADEAGAVSNSEAGPNRETQPTAVDNTDEVSSKEVPDSQEQTPEKMDVDGPEVAGDAPSQNTVPAADEKADGAPDPTTPTATKDVPKESSQVPERAVTRVSSGALRLKSVSEIVGDTPRATPTLERSATHKSVENQLTPLTSTPQSPFSRHRNMLSHRRERSRSQPSAVVFGKQPKRVEEKAVMPGQKEIQPTDDYYTPLFVQGFTGSSTWMQPIEKILFTANKTVATPDANLAIQDHQACKVLRRVYHLQQHDKWSLRQPKRCPEPTRPPSHWDVMLQEVKWMRTDFREERKWKMVLAKNLAYACAEWYEATPEERKLLQVSAVIPPKSEPVADVAMADVAEEPMDNEPTPDLVSSGDIDSPDVVDELHDDFVETVAPSAIFALHEDDVIFGLKRTPAADRLLDELPMYGAPLTVPKFDLTGPEYDPDAHWRRPALPLSKYVEGQMKLVSEGPPRKRSRFDYQNEDSDDEDGSVFVGNAQLPQTTHLPPETNEVALFNPDMKPIRDRLHAGHQFRPPSEHPMPTQGFYECRNPSQWTVAEDDELRSLVREYSYNWSLISSLLSTKSMFSSGAERRTPWECFERWINLEGLPADMQKTQYFKAYNSRIDAAQRVILQQNQLAAQQAQQATAAGNAVTAIRRRPSTPLRVERRRAQKHLTLIDAMRRLAKKREAALQKQQHNASQNAANKKTNEAVVQGPTKTPRDYSLLRWERDQALAEKMAQYAQRQEAQRRVSSSIRSRSRSITYQADTSSLLQAALQARAQGQAAQLAGAAGVAQAGQAGAHVAGTNGGVNGVAGRVNVPNQLAVAAAAAAAAAGQGRPRIPMQSPANGMAGIPNHMAGGLVPPAQMNGVPQAQMQAMQGQHRMPMPNPQPDVNLMMRAQRISDQQRVAVQMQHAQVGPGTPGAAAAGNQQSPPPNMRNGVNGMTQQSFMNNAQAMMASFNAGQNGHSTPPANGLHMPSGPAGSPGARSTPQLPPSIANQLNQLEAQFRAKNPNLTPEQARQLATESLTRAMMAQRQSAMNAAAGANGQAGLANNLAATTSPHQYAALLRQQQQQQANQAAGSPGQQHQAHPIQRQGSQAASSPAQQHQAHPIQRQPSQPNQAVGSPAQQHQHQHQQQQQQHAVPRPQQVQPQQQHQQQHHQQPQHQQHHQKPTQPQHQVHQHPQAQTPAQQQQQQQHQPTQTPRQQTPQTPQQVAQQAQQAQQAQKAQQVSQQQQQQQRQASGSATPSAAQ